MATASSTASSASDSHSPTAFPGFQAFAGLAELTNADAIKAALRASGEQGLAMQKSAIDWQRTQIKLVREQTASGIGFGVAGFDANAEFVANASRSILDAAIPKTAAQ